MHMHLLMLLQMKKLFFLFCLLVVVCCLLFVVCCLLFVVCCLFLFIFVYFCCVAIVLNYSYFRLIWYV